MTSVFIKKLSLHRQDHTPIKMSKVIRDIQKKNTFIILFYLNKICCLVIDYEQLLRSGNFSNPYVLKCHELIRKYVLKTTNLTVKVFE